MLLLFLLTYAVILFNYGYLKLCLLISSLMIEHNNKCPICLRQILGHTYTVYCGGCHKKVHKQCATNSDADFIHAIEDKCWICRLCCEIIFPFNHLDEYDYVNVIYDLSNEHLILATENDHVFNPFESNDDDNDFPHGDIDPDSNFYNDIAHQLQVNSNYYLENSLNKYLSKHNVSFESFSVAHLNIRSIPAHLTEFQAYMENIEHKFSVYGFTETWLTESNQSCYGLPGYNHVNVVRKERSGGGASLFISDVLEYNEIDELTDVNAIMETVFVEICLNHTNVIVGVVYRPPDTNLQVFNEMYNQHLEFIKKKQCLCYILGDYNINLLKYDDHIATGKFLDDMFANSFIPLINRPTRVTPTSATLIDNIFTNNYKITDKFHQGILTTCISDHYVIFHIWDKKCGTPNVEETKLDKLIKKIL